MAGHTPPSSAPPRADLRDMGIVTLDTILDQGGAADCSGAGPAMTYWLAGRKIAGIGSDLDVKPSLCFLMHQLVRAGAFATLQRIGICPDALWPYWVGYPGGDETKQLQACPNETPSEAALAWAAAHKVTDLVSVRGMDQAKPWIAQGYAVSLGVDGDGKHPSHFANLIGYDDASQTVVVLNNYGPNYGGGTGCDFGVPYARFDRFWPGTVITGIAH